MCCSSRLTASRGRQSSALVPGICTNWGRSFFVRETILQWLGRPDLLLLHWSDRSCALFLLPLPYSAGFAPRDCLHAAPRSAAPDRSVSVSPAVWLQSRRQGRPCCCVGVDASLVVGSRGYKEVEYLRLSLCFALFVSFKSVSCCCRIHQLWPLRCGNNERLLHQLRHPRTLWHLSCFDLTSALNLTTVVPLLDGWSEDEGASVPFGITADLIRFFFSFSFLFFPGSDPRWRGKEKEEDTREGRGDPWR